MDFNNNSVVLKQWEILRHLGSGAFGQVYLAKNTKTGKKVAIKTGDRQIAFEYELYQMLSGSNSSNGIPKLIEFGRQGNKYCLVMSRLGRSLHEHFRKCRSDFHETFILKLAIQLTTRLEFIHNKGVIHRDLKPGNVMLGHSSHDQGTVFLVDFNLGKRFKAEDGTHIKMTNVGFRGTALFASRNAHDQLSLSRRDDLESLAYMMVYLFKGSLPWRHISGKGPSYIKKVGALKKSIPSCTVCHGLPEVFSKFLRAVKRLDFIEKPQYEYYRSIFRQQLERLG